MKLGDTKARRLGKGIRKARIAMDLSLAELASRMYFSAAYLSRIEDGLEIVVSRAFLERLAVCLRPRLFAARAVGLSTEEVCREFTDDKLLKLFTMGQDEIHGTRMFPLLDETPNNRSDSEATTNKQIFAATKQFYISSNSDSVLDTCIKCGAPFYGGAKCRHCGAHQGGQGPDD
ncbi:MAG TPA: helix-turn-helix transcriptional regulator [Dehalococcoidia bacterium]|nr:helix-turn-helix transcriptional regulator [Dehalococcoidia bacterium]